MHAVTLNPTAPTATEVEIEREAYTLPIERLVSKLVSLTGVVVAGTIGAVKSERAVRRWVAGERRPDREPQLRFAYRIASMIAATCGPLIVQSWFKGANSALGDRSPALVLRDEFSDDVQRTMLNAVRRLAQ